MLLVTLLLACSPGASTAPDSDSDGPHAVPWSRTRPPLASEIGAIRGYTPARSIIHLHSPYSHDACDGDGLPDGAVNEPCRQDLRAALCDTSIDAAFLTDHPAYAADQEYNDLLQSLEGDEVASVDGSPIANRISCDTGHTVTWMPGFEGGFMPVGVRRHAGSSPEEQDAAYGAEEGDPGAAEALSLLAQADAIVLQAHTEGRDTAELAESIDNGLTGVEIFNLHAMFDPSIREDDLGLDGMGWLLDIGPFADDGTAEPDLFFLAVHQHQQVSLDRWDALQRGGPPVLGTAGTDAHQNVLNLPMRDGERFDSYRRMISWFSNILLADGDGPDDYAAALAAGRNTVAFEVLGTPSGFDAWVEGPDGAAYEQGSVAPEGTLHVGCPTLSPSSPRGLEDPDIVVTVLRDGQPWAEGCGDFDVTGPAYYRVQVEMTPWHLREFLGEDPDPWLHSYPWLYSNQIQVSPGA